MDKRMAAAALLALFAGTAQATVIKFSNMGAPYKVWVHNTLCENKRGAVGVSPGYSNYLQLDWRGGCTDSCVDYFLVYNTDGDFCMGKVQIWNQCRTQTIKLSGDGKSMPSVSGDFSYTRVDFGMAATKDISRYGCPVGKNGPVPFDGLKK